MPVKTPRHVGQGSRTDPWCLNTLYSIYTLARAEIIEQSGPQFYPGKTDRSDTYATLWKNIKLECSIASETQCSRGIKKGITRRCPCTGIKKGIHTAIPGPSTFCPKNKPSKTSLVFILGRRDIWMNWEERRDNWIYKKFPRLDPLKSRDATRTN